MSHFERDCNLSEELLRTMTLRCDHLTDENRAGMSVPCYAIDDETAIKVVDGTAEVVSEGHWKFFAR